MASIKHIINQVIGKPLAGCAKTLAFSAAWGVSHPNGVLKFAQIYFFISYNVCHNWMCKFSTDKT
ncbi:hypothetical protein GAGA_1198 [Paraglaciecola agarilytica NO2]|uniref:Uncharacterized protein n=1 Tax=Paraglaciecola agarilytica NO2 TaxID=1125747 RepID=A0ABQ0I3Z5_9ALTE|nr:hypothetical protein GAGA_1198 [Paraglaciecola agarilytica NO2]